MSLRAAAMMRTWSTLPKMMRMLPVRKSTSLLRVVKDAGMTRVSYRICAARRQTPDDIAQRTMRAEERGSKTQLTLSKRVERRTRNQPVGGSVSTHNDGDL